MRLIFMVLLWLRLLASLFSKNENEREYLLYLLKKDNWTYTYTAKNSPIIKDRSQRRETSEESHLLSLEW